MLTISDFVASSKQKKACSKSVIKTLKQWVKQSSLDATKEVTFSKLTSYVILISLWYILV